MSDQNSNKKLVVRLLSIVAMMSVFVFAMIPLYDVFCEITGINGKIVNKSLYESVTADKSRTIKVEFITQVNSGMPWEFKSTLRSVNVHPGEMNEVVFYAKNISRNTITGQAVPSIAPSQATFYLNKTECFCFEQQTLVAGEEINMPMKFYVDPEIPDNLQTITLSYVLYNATSKTQAAAR